MDFRLSEADRVLIEHVRDTVIDLFGNVRHGATRK